MKVNFYNNEILEMSVELSDISKDLEKNIYTLMNQKSFVFVTTNNFQKINSKLNESTIIIEDTDKIDFRELLNKDLVIVLTSVDKVNHLVSMVSKVYKTYLDTEFFKYVKIE